MEYHTSFSWSYHYTLHNLTQGRTIGRKIGLTEDTNTFTDLDTPAPYKVLQASLCHYDKDWEIYRRKDTLRLSFVDLSPWWAGSTAVNLRQEQTSWWGANGRINHFTSWHTGSRTERPSARVKTPSIICPQWSGSSNEVLPSSSHYLLKCYHYLGLDS